MKRRLTTNAKLKNVFDYYNRKYFNNKLPKDWVIEFRRTHFLGYCDFDSEEIILNSSWAYRSGTKLWRATLLHEMCHLACPGTTHGKEWQQEMLRIAKLGAFNKVW